MRTYGNEAFSGLITDLYELTMAAGYIQKKFDARATFELFVRHLPSRRNYLVVAGLEQAFNFVENVGFSEEDISYLRSLPIFQSVESRFFQYLSRFRFTGDISALPEGTVFFPGEPVVRVTAPIAEAQIIETSLLSIIHLQTLIASKAGRLITAAAGRPVVEFGSRRAHGIDAGVLAARAAFIGGCNGTSNTYAGKLFGLPVYGTQAHSWIMAHQDEACAFRDFLEVFPAESTLLIDTYDVRTAVERIIAMGRKPKAVRLDSGDLVVDSRWCRQRLDAAGWNDVRVFASGDLDEDRIAELLGAGASIDAFGVGTALATSADAPSLGVIYKLVELEIDGKIRWAAKFSEDKTTYPGRKQVFRFTANDGSFAHDVIGLEDESFPDAEPLLVPVVRQGQRIDSVAQGTQATAQAARDHFLNCRNRLPPAVLGLAPARPYSVSYSTRLEQLRDQLRQTLLESSPARSGT
jgi:nicotinate phosphoribosyltransferase